MSAASGALCLQNGTVVLPEGMKKADIYIENGRIAGIGEHFSGAERVYDASGCLVMPGFIDAHTHFMVGGKNSLAADDFASGTAAALAGGTTTVIDFAEQERGGTLNASLSLWQSAAAGKCACDYGFHMTVTDWNEDTRAELSDMAREGVTSFKAYMANERYRVSDEALSSLFAAAGALGCLTGVHCELGDEALVRAASLVAVGKTGAEHHPLSRPNWVEAAAVQRALALAERHGAPVWIVHLSTAEGLREVGVARSRGQTVLLETCPQYLTLTEEVYSRSDGANFICSPPMRGDRDINVLWDAVHRRLFDLVSSDHCAYTPEKKAAAADFTQIPNGLPAVQERPCLLWVLGVNEGVLTVPEFSSLMSEKPARAFGLWPQKGRIAPGADADLVVWDTRERWTIEASRLLSRAGWSPWEGVSCTGRARAVFLRGVLAAENGRVLEGNGGRFIKRGLPLFP